MRTKLITAPAVEPITLTEAKNHLRVDASADDDLITSLIVAGRRMCEAYVSRKFVTQTWDVFWDYFPCKVIALPVLPVQSMTYLKYYDEDGTLTTLDTADYQYTTGAPAHLAPAPGEAWPATEFERLDAVVARIVAGEGLAAAVPDDVKAAIKLAVGTLYEHREGVVTGTIVTELPRAAQDLLNSVEWGSYW